MENSVNDLEVLLRSRIPIILVETSDELRALDIFSRLARRVAQPVMRWSVTTGLQRLDLDLLTQPQAAEPAKLLERIKATATAGIYVLLDFHPYLDDPAHVRLIKEIALGYGVAGHTLVFVSHRCDLPVELHTLTARYQLHLPGCCIRGAPGA